MTHLLLADSTIHLASQRIASSWTWYVVRAAGFVAVGLLISLMLSGIGQVTGLTYKFIEPIQAWAIHKAMGLALCAAIAVHVVFIFFDHFVSFSIPQLLIPWLSQYNNGTSFLGLHLGRLAISMGILAMYGVIIIILSSLGWIDTKKRAWRWLHYLSYAVMGLVFIHAASAGTDLRYGTFRAGWMLVGGILLLGVITRLWRAGTLKKDA